LLLSYEKLRSAFFMCVGHALVWLISYFRSKKWDLFLEILRPTANCKVLDVGFSESEYRPTDNLIEKKYPYPERLTALGIQKPAEFSRRYPKVKAVTYDGNIFPFKRHDFDLCWSNAVIEHVGDRRSQAQFLKEIKRVSKRSFVTTPNRLFPIEVHTRVLFLHMFPKRLFDEFLKFVGKEWATGHYMNLLTYNDLKSLMRMAGIWDYRVIRNKLLFFTVELIVVF